MLGGLAMGCGGSSSQGGSCKYQCLNRTDADLPDVAELITMDAVTTLNCDGVDAQVIDTSDTSCFPSQNNGAPDFIDFTAMAGCTAGACTLP